MDGYKTSYFYSGTLALCSWLSGMMGQDGEGGGMGGQSRHKNNLLCVDNRRFGYPRGTLC